MIRFLRSAVLDREWAQSPVSNITTARYTFNSFVTALREQLQLQAEKRSCGSIAHTMYQRYGRAPDKRSFKHSSEGKNPIGRDGKRMLCLGCGSDEHLIKSGKFAKDIVRKKLANGTSAVHVLHELIESMEMSQGAEEPRDEETGHVQDESELAEFDALQDRSEDGEVDTRLVDAIDMSSASYYIGGVMNPDADVPTHIVDSPHRQDFRSGRTV